MLIPAVDKLLNDILIIGITVQHDDIEVAFPFLCYLVHHDLNLLGVGDNGIIDEKETHKG